MSNKSFLEKIQHLAQKKEQGKKWNQQWKEEQEACEKEQVWEMVYIQLLQVCY